MPADPFEPVHDGQELEIPAEAYNAFIEVALAHRRRLPGRADPTTDYFDQAGIIYVRNDTGADRYRFEIVGLDSPVIGPSDSLLDFQNLNGGIIKGVLPDIDLHLGKFAVLLEPVPHRATAGDRNAVKAVVSGVAVCKVNIVSTSDTFCDVEDGTAARLKSGNTGAGTILWAESGTGEKWAVVRIGGGGGGEGPNIRLVRVSSVTEDADGYHPGYARSFDVSTGTYADDGGQIKIRNGNRIDSSSPKLSLRVYIAFYNGESKGGIPVWHTVKGAECVDGAFTS
jgi:hypothetical protein